MSNSVNTAPRQARGSMTTKHSAKELVRSCLASSAHYANKLFSSRPAEPRISVSPFADKNAWWLNSDYNYERGGITGSVLFHLGTILLLFASSLVAKNVVQEIKRNSTDQVTDISPYLPAMAKNCGKPGGDCKSGGGGGGGDRDKLAASKGALPKLSRDQFAPPSAVIRNPDPKLAVEPTVVVPPEIKLPQNGPLGDPLAQVGPPSNGTGFGGGIGTGSGGGVGSGEGPGVGPGRGGGIGGGVYRVGGGVSAPRIIYQPDPEYSEEARKAKYQGTVVLSVTVGPDGRAHDVRVARSLGLGLDEKAIEAIRQWKFEPARLNGQAVSVGVNVEVNFRLY